MATRTRKKKQPDAETVYVCVDGFSYGSNEGYPVSLSEGTRLRGDHEAVRKHPNMFIEDHGIEDRGKLVAAKNRLRAEASAAAEQAADTGRVVVPQPIPKERRLRVKRDYILTRPGTEFGYSFHAGEVVDEKNDIVREIRKSDRRLFEALFEQAG